MDTNSLGQSRPYGTMQTTVHKLCLDSLEWKYAQSSAPTTQQAASYRKIRDHASAPIDSYGPVTQSLWIASSVQWFVYWYKYNTEKMPKNLTSIFEGIPTRIYGNSFNSTRSPEFD